MLAFILQFLIAVIIASTAVYLYRLVKKMRTLQGKAKRKKLRSPDGGIKAPWGW